MNVIMPVAMTTMHEDPELAANSAKTGERGLRVLQALSDISDVTANARAILAVAADDQSIKNNYSEDDDGASSDPKLIKVRSKRVRQGGFIEIRFYVVGPSHLGLLQLFCFFFQYWTDFFEKWGYKENQKKDIASAMTQLLQNA
jgi:hypothetical protein